MDTEAIKEADYLKKDFEDFFQESLCGYIISTTNGVIEKANKKIAQWSGCTTDNLNGKRFSDLLSIGGKIYYETHLSPLLRMQGYFDEVVLELKKHNGEKLRVMVNALERRDSEGRPLFIRFTVLKASDRMMYEQNLQQAKTSAETELVKQTNITAVREQLIAVLGHDLRNPLAAIAMAVELLEMPAVDEEELKHLVTTLKRSSMRMSELVTNIMDFAKTRLGGGINLNKRDCLLKPVLQQIADELQLVNNKREIITSFQIDGKVNCDPDRIGQLMSNLLANALTHGNSITPIYISATNDGGMLRLTVTNSGLPIPKDIVDNIFTPFARESYRPSKQGLGLGLYISKQIADAHGGSLTCVSDEQATTFTFTL